MIDCYYCYKKKKKRKKKKNNKNNNNKKKNNKKKGSFVASLFYTSLCLTMQCPRHKKRKKSKRSPCIDSGNNGRRWFLQSVDKVVNLKSSPLAEKEEDGKRRRRKGRRRRRRREIIIPVCCYIHEYDTCKHMVRILLFFLRKSYFEQLHSFSVFWRSQHDERQD